jgi:hypothetical protein
MLRTKARIAQAPKFVFSSIRAHLRNICYTHQVRLPLNRNTVSHINAYTYRTDMLSMPTLTGLICSACLPIPPTPAPRRRRITNCTRLYAYAHMLPYTLLALPVHFMCPAYVFFLSRCTTLDALHMPVSVNPPHPLCLLLYLYFVCNCLYIHTHSHLKN